MLSNSVQAALSEALPSSDPFDDPAFNAITLINQKFPTEHSPGVEDYVDRLGGRLKRLDNEILKAIETQSTNGARVTKDITDAKEAILALGKEMKTMKGRAEETEGMVADLTRDMNSLHTAKSNLTATITVMRRLSMWISAVEQLSTQARLRNYGDAANLLEAVKQLGTHFDGFREIDQITELHGTVAKTEALLRAQLMEDFKQLSFQMDDHVRDSLAQGCRVVDALGPKFRRQVIDWVSTRELSDYADLFDPFKASVTLEVTEKRYLWLRKKLQAHQHAYQGVFPAAWKMSLELAKAFGVMTRKHLELQLSKLGPEQNVRLLLHVINKTMETELEITKTLMQDPVVVDGSGVTTSSSSSSSSAAAAAAAPAASPHRLTTFVGFISGVFEPYMTLYLKLEGKSMREQVEKLLSQEKWVFNEAKVLESSTELFLYIKGSLKQCSSITTKHTLVSLASVFQQNLQVYANAVANHVQTLTKGTKTLSKDQEAEICAVINTGEYCYETVGQLQDTFKRTVDPDLACNIDMTKEQELFQGVVDVGLSALVAAMISKVDNALDSMKLIPWATLDSVGDQSAFVNDFVQVLSKIIPRIAGWISTSHFKFFLDKFVSMFVPCYIERIYKCRRISDTGVQQLLLDTAYVTRHLLSIPSLSGNASVTTSSYNRLVEREMAKPSAILKVLLSSPELIHENFRELVQSGTPADFQRILELKGLKSREPQESFKDISATVTSAVSQNLTYIPKVLRDFGSRT